MEQIKNRFDKVTRKKLFKSFLLTVLSGSASGITCYGGTGDLNLSLLTGVAAMITFVHRIISEYSEGVEDGRENNIP